MEKIDLIAEYWINLYKEDVISAYLALKCSTFEMEFYYDNKNDFELTQGLKELKNALLKDYLLLTEEDITHIIISCLQMYIDNFPCDIGKLLIDLCEAINNYQLQNKSTMFS